MALLVNGVDPTKLGSENVLIDGCVCSHPHHAVVCRCGKSHLDFALVSPGVKAGSETCAPNYRDSQFGHERQRISVICTGRCGIHEYRKALA